MILKRPSFWLILVLAAVFAILPTRGQNAALREDLILVAVAITLVSNLNLLIGYTGYVNFGHIAIGAYTSPP